VREKYLFRKINEKGELISLSEAYADGILICGASTCLQKSYEDLKLVFSITDLGAVPHILGINVSREDDGSYILNQILMLTSCLANLDMMN
jgi:hypothetical protein